VPGDYDGDGTWDRAVFRDGVWFVERTAPTFLGFVGDHPVPGDYDGDGVTERAVFRPSVGAWYIEGQEPVFFGFASDVPVPADYDGDGVTERAVFRPSVGAWYIEGQEPVFFGFASDVPVPADYDGDGDADIAVYRPETGGWHVQGAPTEFIGTSSDVPVPADYDGDGARRSGRLPARGRRLVTSRTRLQCSAGWPASSRQYRHWDLREGGRFSSGCVAESSPQRMGHLHPASVGAAPREHSDAHWNAHRLAASNPCQRLRFRPTGGTVQQNVDFTRAAGQNRAHGSPERGRSRFVDCAEHGSCIGVVVIAGYT
jgi:hypothetical protein